MCFVCTSRYCFDMQNSFFLCVPYHPLILGCTVSIVVVDVVIQVHDDALIFQANKITFNDCLVYFVSLCKHQRHCLWLFPPHTNTHINTLKVKRKCWEKFIYFNFVFYAHINLKLFLKIDIKKSIVHCWREISVFFLFLLFLFHNPLECVRSE